MEENCKNCVYAGKVEQGAGVLLICTNKPEKEGELVITEENRICENYLVKRRPAERIEVIEPKNDDIRYISLTRGKFAIVNAEDYERFGKFKWFASGPAKYPYAVRAIYPAKGVKVMLCLHREIMKAPEGLVVDHINGNTLDNRRENLRMATRRQNTCNMRINKEGCTSKYRGVGWHRTVKKWVARITVNRRRIHLGVFDNEIEAAKAYDAAARKYHGEFARLNFPE